MKITSSMHSLYPMWLSEPQMKNSINHNLNMRQLFHCFKLFCLISIFICKNILCISFHIKNYLHGAYICTSDSFVLITQPLYFAVHLVPKGFIHNPVQKCLNLPLNKYQVLPKLSFRTLKAVKLQLTDSYGQIFFSRSIMLTIKCDIA